MRTLVLTTALTLAVATGTGATAQTAGQPVPQPAATQPPAPASAEGPPSSGTRRSDYIDKSDQQFDRLDANHDGVVTREEVDLAADEIAKTIKARMARQFARADADHDGRETRAEFQAVAGRRYDRLDGSPEGRARIDRTLNGAARQP